jgi:CubicO group peptidase (beta-lactamase class C family)
VRRFRDRAIRLLRPRPFCRTREQTMIEITRRQAIGTMGTAAAFATGLARPVFAETAAGSAGIDQALTEAVKTGRVPGVVALAANDKGTIYSGAFGVRSLGQSQAMTLDSVFWIASMTKAVTTTAAMQMVEQGKLKLDQPASPAGFGIGAGAGGVRCGGYAQAPSS